MELASYVSEKHKDTALVGTNAEIKVLVTDENNQPVANKEVVLTSKEIQGPNTTGLTKAADYENKTDDVLKTDANGYVTFVFGLDKSNDSKGAIDSTRREYVASYKLSANVVGTDVKTDTTLKFGAMTLGTTDDQSGVSSVSVRNNKDNSLANLDLSTNITNPANFGNGVATTKDRNQKNSDYVTSQQVSADEKDHSVTLNTCAYLVMPNGETDTKPSDIVKEVNYSTGKYNVYADTAWQCVIDEAKASELQYATVNFSSLKLSKYTRLEVQAYLVTDPKNPWNNAKWINGEIVDGEKNASNFSVQIPVSANNGYLFINAFIKSQGQVNTDMNDGFTIKNVVGVYNSSLTASGAVSEKLDDVSVEWSVNNDTTYTMPVALTKGAIYNQLKATYATGYTFEYSVPAFPFTGNAVITVYDTNKKAVAYYAAMTENEQNWVPDATGTYVMNGYKNKNVLTDTVAYQITKSEAFDMVGTVTNKDGNAVVDSTKTGVTHLVGTITSKNANLALDASNSKVYSSVQWNPVPTATASTTTQAGAALVGQKITLKAQLTDKNGNAVTNANEPIEFLKDGKTIDATTDLGDVALIKADTQTDANGQASLIVTAANPAQLTGLSAKLQSNKYSLAYSLASEKLTADAIDLYWVDADLAFVDRQDGTPKETKTDKANPSKEVTTGIEPMVNTNWQYGVKVSGTVVDNISGALGGYHVDSISGMDIKTQANTTGDCVGTATNVTNGKADVTSAKTGTTYLINTLDSSSVGKAVTFTFKNAANATVTLPNVGEGTTTLDKKLTLDIKWQTNGATASIIVPSGIKAVSGSSIDVYVLVADNAGNPIVGKSVTMNTSGTGTVSGAAIATTDANGIVKYTLSDGEAGKTTVLKATVDGIDNTVFSESIKWISGEGLATPDITKAVYDYSAKTITLTFNSNIYAKSVVSDLFTVKYDGKEQIVGNVTVSGNQVTISVPQLGSVDKDTVFTVDVNASKTVKGIDYTLTTTDGLKFSKTDVAVDRK